MLIAVPKPRGHMCDFNTPDVGWLSGVVHIIFLEYCFIVFKYFHSGGSSEKINEKLRLSNHSNFCILIP